MDKINSMSDATSMASAAGLLSSLNDGINSESAEAKLFANFLSQSQGTPTDQSNASVSSNVSIMTSTKSSAVVTNATSTTSQVLPSLKTLTSAWHAVLNKLQSLAGTKAGAIVHNFTAAKINNGQTNTSGKKSTASYTNATDANNANTTPPAASYVAVTTPSTVTLAGATRGSSSFISGAAATDSAAASSDSLGFGVNGQSGKTTAELLSELAVIAQLIAKQLQATSTAQGNLASGTLTANTSVTAGTNATDLTNTAPSATTGFGSTADTGLMSALNEFSMNLQGLGVTGTTSASPELASAVSGNANSPDSSATSAGAGSDATTSTTPAQALTSLLALVQNITQQLDATSGAAVNSSADSTSTNGSSASAAILVSPNAEVTANLQNMLDGMKPNATLVANNTTNATSTLLNTNTLTADAAVSDSLLSSSGAALKMTPLSGGQSKTTGAQSDALAGVFTSAVKTNADGTVVASSVAATTGATTFVGGNTTHNDGAFDLNKDNQSGNSFAASGQTAKSDMSGLSSTLGSTSSVNSPYSFSSQLALTKAATLGTTGLLPAVEQVMLQMNRNAKSGNDQMTLQLNPAELGRVSIKLDIGTDGKVQGTVVASNPATLDLLQKDSRSLERALQDAGLRADPGSLQFSLGGQGQAGNNLGKTTSGTTANSTIQNVVDDAAALDPSEIYYVTPGRVNLRV